MLKKIRVFDLQVGMYVVDTGLSWLDHPYLYCTEGFVESEEDIKAIRAEGFSEAFIETDKDQLRRDNQRIYDKATVDRAMADALRDSPPLLTTNKCVPLASELQVAGEVHSRSLTSLRYAMEAVASGVPLEIQQCLDAARDIAASVSRNRDALICLSRLHDGGGYHVRHGVGVSVLAAAFGDFLGLNRNQVSELAVAGLLHDVGKALTPRDLLERPGKLSEEEYQRVKRHPIESCAVVSGSTSLAAHVLRGIAEHHERHDGSGYPRGLKGPEQSFFGRILAIADVFDALTQKRPYKERLLPDKAMSVMYALRGRDFEPGLLERFIKCLGVYPAGSLVRMSSGEYAVVAESNPDTPLRPKITVVFDQDMTPIHPVSVDLSGKQGLAPARPLEVAAVVDHRTHGIRTGEHLL
ncbi:MAG: HD-GYP domain-containing protein [Acidobacteriota bacterium]